jgi:RimJ/RimL family protein N-acetyltransferase
MTEAVGKFCEWALTDGKIETIIAETEIKNIASKRVLERCGFVRYKEEETAWWKLNRMKKTCKIMGYASRSS